MKAFKQKIMQRSRARKLEHFYSICAANSSVLDVGVSAENIELNRTRQSRNVFLKTFRYAPHQYTGLGIQNLTGLADRYKGKRFVQYAGGRFPFGDKCFDWVFCNAVIEHVGTHENQIEFINEMLRVGKMVFFTTPSKWFPIESHTNVLVLHWCDSIFFAWCWKYRSWCTPERLNLLSKRGLDDVMKKSGAKEYRIFRNRLFGLTMTLTVVATRR